MSVPTWRLMGSAESLDDIRAMVVQRWYWSVCEAIPTDDPKVWSVASGNGPSQGMRIRQAGKRYRLESR